MPIFILLIWTHWLMLVQPVIMVSRLLSQYCRETISWNNELQSRAEGRRFSTRIFRIETACAHLEKIYSCQSSMLQIMKIFHLPTLLIILVSFLFLFSTVWYFWSVSSDWSDASVFCIVDSSWEIWLYVFWVRWSVLIFPCIMVSWSHLPHHCICSLTNTKYHQNPAWGD